MNYYKRFMGDYARDTGHLSLVEHGVYTVLLDHYYSTGAPLPGSFNSLYRICRAIEEIEQAAVRTIAEAHFPLAADGCRHNHRADEEIAVWTERADANRENGKGGGRPKKPKENPDGFEVGSESQTEGETDMVSPSVPSSPSHSLFSPDSPSQPEARHLASLGDAPAREGKAKRSKRLPTAYVLPDSVRQWAKSKAPDVNLDAEVEAIRDHEFRDAHSDWDAVVRGWVRREQKTITARKSYRARGEQQPVRRAREFGT